MRVDLAGKQKRVGIEETLLGVGWELIGQEVIECCAKRVDIRANIGMADITPVLLQGSVGDGASPLEYGDGAGII